MGVMNSLYYAVKIGDVMYAAFFDDEDAIGYALMMSRMHPGNWYIEDLMTGRRWLVNKNAVRL